MPDIEYLTVKDFAARAGVSTQRIYQLLAKDLQAYCKEVDGTKVIAITALERFSEKPVASPLQSDLPSAYQEFTKSLQDQIDSLKGQNKLISDQLAVKDEQLSAKDKQIEALNVALTTAQQTIADTTAALTAAQALHAGTLQRLTVAAERDEDEAVEAVPEQPTTPEEQAQPKKKGFFARLFGK